MRNSENAPDTQPDPLTEDFLARMNASTAYWQQQITAIAQANIAEIEQPKPQIPRQASFNLYPFAFIFQLIHPLQRQRQSQIPRTKPGLRVTIIAPGIELIEGDSLPDTVIGDSTPPDTKSELHFIGYAFRKEDYDV